VISDHVPSLMPGVMASFDVLIKDQNGDEITCISANVRIASKAMLLQDPSGSTMDARETSVSRIHNSLLVGPKVFKRY
jgi:hypothetical protein